MKKRPLLSGKIRKVPAFQDIALSIKSPPVSGYEDDIQAGNFLTGPDSSAGT